MPAEEPHDIIERYPEADQEWAKTFFASMVWNDLTNAQVALELDRTLSMVRDSGQRAEELFGHSGEYGATRAQCLLTPEQRADAELPVESSTALLAVVGMLVGLLCTGFGIWIGFRDGWTSSSWHYWQLSALTAGAGIALSGYLWWFNRLKGKFGLSWILGPVGILVSVGAAALIVQIGGSNNLLPLPNWLAPILGAALVVACFYLMPAYKAQKAAGGQQILLGTDEWFAETTRLLRGRYGMSHKEANESLSTAREHLDDAATRGEKADPNLEFGTPNEFVIGLAVNTEKALKRRWLLRRMATLAVVALFAVGAVAGLMDPARNGGDIFFGVAVLVFAAVSVYELRPADRKAYVQEKLKGRAANARALQERDDD
ncbi:MULTISPECIES: hypothetical protein [unclassified Glutamicibacter]|uniref:hypothetical protein n=1 Tax=unclassified Glutamicibacter TaxID=2627139 RepID=UPI0037FEB380